MKNSPLQTLREPAREIAVVEDCDICVVGGSCTGVFAAVRAARLGARVALVENNGFFGGVATAGLVNVWHSFFNTTGETQIIAGLTEEVATTLRNRGAAHFNDRKHEAVYLNFNPAELILALDALVAGHPNIRPFLHTRACAVSPEAPGKLNAVIIENVSGRQAIRAKMFVDATGNADLVVRAGGEFFIDELRLPPTTCALYSGIQSARAKDKHFKLDRIVLDPQNPRALRGFLWDSPVPGLGDINMVAGTRVNNVNASDADELTFAEMEGRDQIRRTLELVNSAPNGEHIRLVGLAAHIGVRDTRHARCLHHYTEMELLEGVAFDDTIAHGSYRVDIHYADKPGLFFRYLDGRESIVNPPLPSIEGRWREARAVNPTYYNIPYRSLLPKNFDNLLVCGRALDADRAAFSAARVMVNLNQTGEACGTAAALAIEAGTMPAALDVKKLQATLRKGGSALL